MVRETSHPDLGEARAFAEAIHAQFPGKLLAYECSPLFTWRKRLDDATIASFQREVGAGHFDAVTNAVTKGQGLTCALAGSTESTTF